MLSVKNSNRKYVDFHTNECDYPINQAWQGVPSIAITKGGRIFIAYISGGIYEPDPRNCAYIIASEDNGVSFTNPLIKINSERKEHLRVSDTELWVDPEGRLWVFFAVTPYRANLELPTYEQVTDMENESEYHLLEEEVRTLYMVCDNPDADELVFGEIVDFYGGVIRNKPLVMSNGKWMFPVYTANIHNTYTVLISVDKGLTYETITINGREEKRSYDEPCLYEIDNKIYMTVRMNGTFYNQFVSYDFGYTWSQPYKLCDVSSQRPCLVKLNKQDVIMVRSISNDKIRKGLKACLSIDGGVTFSSELVIDSRDRVSYPEISISPDGHIFIVYDRERNNKIKKNLSTMMSSAAKEILLAKISIDDIKEGQIKTDSFLQKVVSKAGIDSLINIFTQETLL